ncbi:MAG: nucleotidyltransferase family protein [Clostridia bacterium]|nr:nucleotidyltransferase family protein [Clostridia bacterium]
MEFNQRLFDVIKKSLWNTGKAAADEEVFREMKAHAIAALAAPVLKDLSLPENLLRTWERTCVSAFMGYQRCLYAQNSLPVTVPYVILKGTAAAQYYPHPEYRNMGDIDIMTSHEDNETACGMMLKGGYHEDTNAVDQYLNRHREFRGQYALVEVHSYYALRDKKEEVKALDDLIIDNIRPNHLLPDLVNGLTLIEHINHHMESGLGLRQIIDWMMFVDRCLPDSEWPAFEAMARVTGHVELSVVVTRMCELYLGLSRHSWCSHVDTGLCADLMEYILSCGNFGRKIEQESLTSQFLLSSPTMKAKIITLKQRGVISWKAAQKYPILRPVAWVYQGGRYLVKGLTRKNAFSKIRAEYASSKKRNRLFNSIGVAREKKGRVTYYNGEYVNNKH